MADAAVKEAAPAKTAAPADAAAKAKGGLMGPLLAVVVLLGIGGGVGFFVASSLPALAGKAKDGEKAEHAEGAERGEKGEKGEKKGNALAGLAEVQLTELVTNVKNQDGRRYVKVSCSIWVGEADEKKLVPPAVEAGEGTPVENETVKRILRMRLEEHLKGYDLVDLTSPNIMTQLSTGFRDNIERELHAIYTDVGPEYRFVKRIVLYNLLVQ